MSPAKAPSVEKAVAAAPALGPTREIRILLVEDHDPTRIALSHLLTRRLYKVLPAATIAEAREISNREKIDFVISDIGLPDGNGNALMRELHERYGLNGLALTGYGMEQDVQKSLASGFVKHLVKPVNVRSLENVLEECMVKGKA
jgi:DNA-binding response OmpR family regulator